MGVEALEKWHFRDAWLSNVSLADQRYSTDAASAIAKPFSCDFDLHQ
jgi:hypothetical protein